MKTYIFIHNNVPFKSKLNNIHDPVSQRFILFAGTKCLHNLSLENKHCFAQIHHLDSFDLEALDKVLQPYLSTDVLLISDDELCLLDVARLREKYNIEGDKVADVEPFINKLVMKSRLQGSAIRYPQHIKFNHHAYFANPEHYINTIAEHIRFPLIAKPIDAAGAMFTNKLLNVQQLKEWAVHERQVNITYEIDEFIEGKLFHCDAVMQNGEVLSAEVSEYAYPVLQFVHGQVLTSIPLMDDSSLRARILAYNEQVMALFPPHNGSTHLELFLTAEDEFVFLEVAGRAPGAYITPMYEKAYGINYEELHFLLQMRLPVNINRQLLCYCAFAYFPLRKGKVSKLLNPDIKSEFKLNWFIKAGDELAATTEMAQLAAGMLFWNVNYQALYDDFNYIKVYMPYQIEE
jgi:hypothetical protein